MIHRLLHNLLEAVLPCGGKMFARGTSVPANSATGYAKGCLFVQTDGTDETNTLYINLGTTSSADFNVVTSEAVSPADLTYGAGTTLPTSGYAEGALFAKTDETAPNILFCNIGSSGTPDWNLITVAPSNVQFASGTIAEAGAATGAGYAVGCLWFATDGSDHTDSLYCNIGTTTVANFNAVTVAAD